MDDIKRKRIRDNWATLVAAELVEMSNEWNFEPPRNNTDTPAPENAGNVDYLKRSNNMLLIYLQLINFGYFLHLITDIKYQSCDDIVTCNT